MKKHDPVMAWLTEEIRLMVTTLTANKSKDISSLQWEYDTGIHICREDTYEGIRLAKEFISENDSVGCYLKGVTDLISDEPKRDELVRLYIAHVHLAMHNILDKSGNSQSGSEFACILAATMAAKKYLALEHVDKAAAVLILQAYVNQSSEQHDNISDTVDTAVALYEEWGRNVVWTVH